MDFKAFFRQISRLYQNLSLKQRIVIASTIVSVVAFLVFLVLYTSSGTKEDEFDGYSVLFRNINPADSAQIINQLESEGVKYKLADEGTILVPTKDVYRQRIAVATLGLSDDRKRGFEIFDKQEFGATQEEQRVKFQRAIQGELSRTIESLEPIERATVYIALPKDSVFTERQTPPTASVVVKIRDGDKLSRKQIDGIKRIVAGSVANLKIEDVKIVTQDGVALGDDAIALENELVAAQIRYKNEFESIYEQKIIDMIGKFIGGKDKVTAKVSIDFDFSTKDSQSEVYDPNSVVRSEQTIEEKREGKEPKDIGGVPGAVSNIGPVQGLEDDKASENYSKNVANTNYEISKTTTTVKDEYATIRRITAAVVVDGKYEPQKNENGETTDVIAYTPLNEEELGKIQALVEQAVGYNRARGDVVTVSNFEFKPTQRLTQINKFELIATSYIKPFLPIIKYIIAIIILILFYRKVIAPYMEKMISDMEPEEIIEDIEPTQIEEDTEDTLEKFKAAKKRAEDELGITKDFNENDLRYEVLLEKMKLIAAESSEEFANMLQNMVKNDASFTPTKDI